MEELKTFTTQAQVDKAVELIQADPRKVIPIIDESYGRGTAQKLLAGEISFKTDDPVEPEMTNGEKRAQALSRRPRMSGPQDIDLGQAVMDAAAVAGEGITELAKGIGRGMIGAPTEQLETVANANAISTEQADSLFDQMVQMREKSLGRKLSEDEIAEFRLQSGATLAGAGMAVRDERVDFDTQDVVDSLGLTETLEVDSTLGHMAEGVSQFATGYLMLGGGGTLTKALAVGAVTDATSFDPYEQNIAGMMQEYEWTTPFIEEAVAALAIDPEASEWENRLKMAGEGLLLGGAIEGVALAVRHFGLVKRASEELATDGVVSPETTEAITKVEESIQKFDDLTYKPKGQVVEGKFVTDDGMIFDMKSGDRDFEAEKLTLSQKVDAQATTDAPARPEAPQSNFNELFENMGEEGALAEYPSIGASLEDYVYNNNRSRIDDILNDPDYTEYKQVLTASLQRQFGNQPIPVTRIEGYSDVNAEKVANDFEVQIDDVIAVGNESELELLVRMDDGEVRSVRLDEKPRVQDPQGVAKAPETSPTAPKKPRSPIINTQLAIKVARQAKKADDPVAFMENKFVGIFNWDNMDGPQDAMKLMDQLGEAMSHTNALKNLQPQSLESINRRAMASLKDLTGADLPQLAERFAATAKSTKDMSVQLVAGKTILQSTARRVDTLIDELDALDKSGRYNSDVEERLIDAINLHADMQASIKSIQTEAARATTAGRIRTSDAISDVALNKIEQFGGSKKLRQVAKRIKAAPTQAAKNRQVRRARERTFLGKMVDVANEVWMNNILSGPVTHALNLGAGTANMFLRPAIRMAGGFATGNTQIGIEGYRQMQYTIAELTSVLANIATIGRVGGDSAIKNAMRSWWREEGILDTVTKFDTAGEGAYRALSAENFGGRGGAITDFAGKAARLSGRTLQAEDEFFKQVIFNARVKAQVRTAAATMTPEQLEKAGYKTQTDFVNGEISKARESQESLSTKYDQMVKLGQVLKDDAAKQAFIQKNIGAYNHNSEFAKAALKEAREATFTTPLPQGTLGKGIMNLVHEFPILRQFMPFIQTPVNILRTSFERTPAFNFLMQQQRDKLMHGTAEDRAELMGNFIVGTLFATTAAIAAANGRITGGGPSFDDDPQMAKLWHASPDWQAYSVNVGSQENPTWWELKKLDPHGFLFGIIGDLHEMSEYLGNTHDPEVSKIGAMVMASFANNIMSKTYLMSLSDTINLFDGSAEPWEWEAFLSNRAASMVPYSSAQYQINQMTDEHMRELRTYTDKVKARIISQNKAAVKHDWLTGEAVETPEYFLKFIRQKKVDSGEHKAAKVYSELRKLNHAFTGPQKKIGDIELSPEVYQRYNELVGTIGGTEYNLLSRLTRYFESEKYKRQSDMADIDQLRSKDDPRVTEVQEIILSAKKNALAKLKSEYPELNEAINKNKSIRAALKNGADPELQNDLVFEFPPK